jgi:hypothetical protein
MVSLPLGAALLEFAHHPKAIRGVAHIYIVPESRRRGDVAAEISLTLLCGQCQVLSRSDDASEQPRSQPADVVRQRE